MVSRSDSGTEATVSQFRSVRQCIEVACLEVHIVARKDFPASMVYYAFPADGEAPRDRRKNLVILSWVFGVLAVVGIIIGVTTHSIEHLQSDGNAPSSASESSPDSVASKFINAPRPSFAVHPILGMIPATPEPLSTHGDDDANVTRYTSSAYASSGPHYTNFSYDVEVVRDIYILSKDPQAMEVLCEASVLYIKFQSNEGAANFSSIANVSGKTVVPVESEWNCGGALIRKVVNVTILEGNIVMASTSNTTIESIFRNAHIFYNGTGVQPSNYSTDQAVQLEFPKNSTTRERRSWLSRTWHHIVHTVEHDGHAIVTDVEAVYDFAKTGSLDIDHNLYSTKFNMGPTKCLAPANSTSDDLATRLEDLTECNLEADFQITFEVHVSNYKLQIVTLYAEGNINGAMDTNGQSINKDWNGEKSYKIFDKTLWSISIPVAGVPIPLSLAGSMFSHMSWNVDGTLDMDADIKVNGMLKVGLEYTGTGGVQPVHVDTLTGAAVMNSASGELTVDGSVELDTIFTLSAFWTCQAVTHIAITPSFHAVGKEAVLGPGGEDVSISGTDVDVTRVTAQPPPALGTCNPTSVDGDAVEDPSFQMNLGVDVEVTAGATLDITILKHKLYDHTFNFGDLYSKDFQFGPWCEHLDIDH